VIACAWKSARNLTHGACKYVAMCSSRDALTAHPPVVLSKHGSLTTSLGDPDGRSADDPARAQNQDAPMHLATEEHHISQRCIGAASSFGCVCV
jgi:hypothetical protein